jgi:hypothetical protein
VVGIVLGVLLGLAAIGAPIAYFGTKRMVAKKQHDELVKSALSDTRTHGIEISISAKRDQTRPAPRPPGATGGGSSRGLATRAAAGAVVRSAKDKALAATAGAKAAVGKLAGGKKSVEVK